MLVRFLYAVGVAIVVALAVFLLGALLVVLQLDPVVVIGEFLKTYAAFIGVLAGVWYFISGRPVLR